MNKKEVDTRIFEVILGLIIFIAGFFMLIILLILKCNSNEETNNFILTLPEDIQLYINISLIGGYISLLILFAIMGAMGLDLLFKNDKEVTNGRRNEKRNA